MTATFYLAVCSMRNSVRLRARRLRQPRYLLIAVGAVLYVGWMIAHRPPSGALSFITGDRVRAQVIAAAAAMLVMALAWVFPIGAALRFTAAEVQFLFTAPITRRHLLGYKVCRLLAAAAGTGAVLTIFIGPRSVGAALMFAGKSTVVLAILAVQEAGVSLYRKNAEDRGPLGRRRLRVLAGAAILTPIAGWTLARVALASRPDEFLWVLPTAALLLGLNVAWVLRSDAAFEEAAAEAADKMLRRRRHDYATQPRTSLRRSSSFALAPQGPVETAILWKNWMLFGRASRDTLIGFAVGITATAIAISWSVLSVFDADATGILTSVVAGAIVLMGPVMLRTDLRHDLGNLDVIKTWPTRGAAVIRGEVLTPAIALTIGTAIPIVVGSAVAPALLLTESVGPAARILFAVSALVAACAAIVTQLVIQNGIVVTFPAWVKVTPTGGPGGLEAIAQMMIVMYGALFVLALASVIPAAAATLGYFALGGPLVPATVFTVLLLAESVAATELLGRILDRTDLADVSVVE